MSDNSISQLRQRMIEDMTARRLSRMGLNPTILRQGRVFPLSLPVHPRRALAAPTARAV